MANSRTILPEMISVSRDCVFTQQLHQIFTEKLSDTDFEILHRWLQIVKEETSLEVNREKRNFRGF
jgi:hypothetical protein